jgi:L-fuculose-phosphate aldolase
MSTDLRPLVVEICHLLAAHNFTTATGGNVSVRLPDDSIWVTPSRLHKARVTVADLVRVDAAGQRLDGERLPTSETPMHLAIYQACPLVQAIVHAHPPTATGFAQAGRTIDTRASSEAMAILGAEVPLIPYARPSTPELASLVAAAIHPGQHAYLLANHGVITWGADLWQAYDYLDTLELFAQSLVTTYLLGGPVLLSADEQAWLLQKT